MHGAGSIAADRRGLRRSDRPGRGPYQRPVPRRPRTRGACGRRGFGLGRERTLRDRDADRARSPIGPSQIDVGGEPTALAFDGRSLWVANGDQRTVAQVDPGSNRVLQRLPVGNASRGVAAGFGALWVTSAVDSAVRRIDLGSSGSSRRIALSARPTAIAAGAGAIWVASDEEGTVSRLDPGTGRSPHRSTWQRPERPRRGRGGGVGRQPPRRNDLANRSRHERGHVDGGRCRPERDRGRRRQRVGGRRQRRHRLCVSTRTRGGSSSASPSRAAQSAVAVADGSVWTSAVALPASHRGGTLRVISPVADMQGADRLAEPAGLRLPHRPTDRTGVRRARRLPAYGGRRRSDDGRCTGHGCPGTERRRSLVRLHAPSRTALLGWPAGAGRGFPSLDRALPAGDARQVRALLQRHRRGRSVCDAPGSLRPVGRHRDRCADADDHDPPDPSRRGVPTQAHACSSHTSCRRTRHGASPALMRRPEPGRTCSPPGMAAAAGTWCATRTSARGRLKPGRPGSPIASRSACSVTRPSARRSKRSSAGPPTWRFSRACSGRDSRRERYAALEVRSPGRLHSYPETGLNYMFLNVRRPPFDDPRVRRALNFATDKTRIVELEGGSGIASSTCQILPSGFPSHDPYCPYTARPGAGRPWSAPDLERARSLVAASGTAGARVVVTVPQFKREIGRYFTELLDRLGYRASLRVLSDSAYFPEIIQDPPSTRAQIAFNGWSSDYLSPSTFFEPNFGCPDNLSHYCERGVDPPARPGGRRPGRRALGCDRPARHRSGARSCP